MSTVDLTLQVQRLDERLAQVEAILRRVEQRLLELQTSQADHPALVATRQPGVVHFSSPRLRHREQAADFVMAVTRDSADARV